MRNSVPEVKSGLAELVTGYSRNLAWFAVLTATLLALCMPAHVHSQAPSTLPGQWVTFDHDDGLPDDEVFAVWGASDGTLWAGTVGGVAYFDGVAWQVFKDDTSALDGAVRAVWGRSVQDVWVAGDAGLAHFDGRNWRRIPAERLGLPEGPLYTILGNESDDELWVGGQEGVAYFDGETWRAFTPQNSELLNGTVHALAVSADNRFTWFGTEVGLVRYEPESDTWLQFAPEDNDLTTMSVLSLRLTGETLWVGTWSGLWRYDLVIDRWTLVDGRHWDGPDIVTSIWATNEELWLAVSAPDIMLADDFQLQKRRSHGGLRRFAGRRWQQHWLPGGGQEQDPYDLGGDDVRAIWSDGEGIFWFATGKGLWRFDSERWQTYFSDSPVGQRADIVRGDADGHLWLGGLEALYTWQGEQWQRDLPPNWSQPLIWTLWATGPDDLWLGSWRNGAAHWDGLRWENFTIEYGLASDLVNAIWADGATDVWFGTSAGLSHLDRVTGQWQTLTLANSDLPDDWISALWSDGQALWVGTLGGGAARYEPVLGHWETFQTVGLVDNDVQALISDATGGLWVATSSGVSHYDQTSGSWQRWAGIGSGQALAVAPNGTVWLSGAASGAYYYTPEADSWQFFAPAWLDSTVNRIWVSPDGTLWFATLGGAIRYDPQTDNDLKLTTRDGLASDDVRAVWGDQMGTLWFATNAGVNRLADGHWQTFTEDDGLAGSNTLLLTGDDSGNVWAAGLNGISRYVGDAWEEVLSWPTPPALWHDLYAPGQGRLWVVAPDGTLHYFNGQNWALVTVADGQLTGLSQTVVEGTQGELWVGSQQGLAQRSANGGSWSTITTAGLIDNEVTAIWDDGKRYVWFATSHGISRYEMASDTWQSFTTTNGLLSNNVTDLWGDRQGRVWAAQDEDLGLSQGGVSVFEGEQWRALPVEGLPSRRVNSVWPDGAGTVWVATMAGPAWWDGMGWHLPQAGPGVGGQVHALWSAADGLWVATEDSLSHIAGDRWQTFTAADGLPAGPLRAVWSDRVGQVWAGGAGGLAQFDGRQWQLLPPEAVPGAVIDIWGRSAADLWVATESALLHFDGTNWQAVLADEEILSLAGEGQEGLWLGTRRGLRHFDGQSWQLVTDPDVPLGDRAVWDIWSAPDGLTWVATSQGVYRIGSSEAPATSDIGPVRAVLQDRSGTLWLATWDSQVYRLDQFSFQQIFEGEVLAIAEDAGGDLWFGTPEGLQRYRPHPPIFDLQNVNLSDGQPVPIADRQIALPYQPGRVTLTLATTDAVNLGEEGVFWYRLEPRDIAWQTYSDPLPDDGRLQILYEGLEPGRYTFNLVVYNENKDTVGRQTWTVTVSAPTLVRRALEHEAAPWVIGLTILASGMAGWRFWLFVQTRRAFGYHPAEIVVQAVAANDLRVTWKGPRGIADPYETDLDRHLIAPYLTQLEAEVTNEVMLRQMGELLFNGLWNKAAQQKLREAKRWGHKGWRLLLNLTEAPAELWALPWEFAYGGSRLEFLGASPDTAIVRYLPSAEPIERPKTTWPLKILIIWAEPTDRVPVKAEEEVAAIRKALQPMEKAGRVQLVVEPHATPPTFARKMKEGADVVHFIGHGALEGGQSVLYFEDEYDHSRLPRTGQALASMLHNPQAMGTKTPRLVVLGVCHSGVAAPGGETLAGLAPALLAQQQVLAVVGMQYPIGVRTAAEFSGHFYDALTSRGGGQVDYAISQARKVLYDGNRARRAWGIPVLYMQVTDGHIFQIFK